MGKMRTEPKKKKLLSDAEYQMILSILTEAKRSAKDHYIFWDLEEGENVRSVKRSFQHVAEKEGLTVNIRHVRGTQSLAFDFGGHESATPTRMSASESRARILSCLERSEQPLKKSAIIKETGISPSTWNIRIKELLNAGKVKRHGDRRDTTYTLETANAEEVGCSS